MTSLSKNHNPIYKIPFINPLTLKIREINRFQSQRFVFTVEKENIRYKAFQVIFGKSDGSLYVGFPYFDITQGLVSIGTIPKFVKNTNIDLKEYGKVTSNRVKYAHHLDGESHFSQDGKVFTSIRRKSVLLKELEGHIFTITIQGLSHFKQDTTDSKDRVKLSKAILNFKLENKKPTIKFVARWYKLTSLINNSSDSNIGPLMNVGTPEGKTYSAFLIGPPKGQPLEEYVMVITCEEIPLVDKENEGSLVFVGGFDQRKIHNDITQTSSFLCLSYPLLDYESIKKQIGSIDLGNNLSDQIDN